MVTWCTTSLTFNKGSAHTVFMCFEFIWEQTATCTTYSINWLVFITEKKGVCSAVRNRTLNKAYWSRDAPTVWHSTTLRSADTAFMCFVFMWEQTATCTTYSINWLVFINEMKSVYSAVRTGSLNKAYRSRGAPTSLTFNNCTLCAHCIYVFCIYLRTNSDLCHLQHKLIGFYNREEKCLQGGTDRVFK